MAADDLEAGNTAWTCSRVPVKYSAWGLEAKWFHQDLGGEDAQGRQMTRHGFPALESIVKPWTSIFKQIAHLMDTPEAFDVILSQDEIYSS